MKQILKKYFTFRKKDRIGLIILSSITFLLIIFNYLIPSLIKNEQTFDHSAFSAEVDSFLVSLQPIEETEYISRLDSFIIARYDTLDLFMFDPNTTTDEEFLNLGLSEKQINTINNYRNKGGKFITKDDFRKIYGIRTKQFQILKPFLDLPEVEPEGYQTKEQNYEKKEYKREIELFEFNPNTANDEDLKKLGLTDKEITTLNKYRNKGGKFYKKEDFKKMYFISDELYSTYEPYIIIENKNEKQNEYKTYTPKEIPIVDINTADTALLKQLPGIGPAYSSRIVKYRNSLGGFIKIEQISEVYGIKPETYNKIEQYLTISSVKIKKININFAEYKDLVKHPYIDSKTANEILNYKKKNGFYTSVEQLSSQNVINQATYDKLKDYLTVE